VSEFVIYKILFNITIFSNLNVNSFIIILSPHSGEAEGSFPTSNGSTPFEGLYKIVIQIYLYEFYRYYLYNLYIYIIENSTVRDCLFI